MQISVVLGGKEIALLLGCKLRTITNFEQGPNFDFRQVLGYNFDFRKFMKQKFYRKHLVNDKERARSQRFRTTLILQPFW